MGEALYAATAYGQKITEEWLGEVGFKYREPGERQPFRHWTLKFNEPSDCGLYLETTMDGFLRNGRHVGGGSWFLWIGRDHNFIHLRHIRLRSEIVAIVEALIGQEWEPDRMGFVRVVESADDEKERSQNVET